MSKREIELHDSTIGSVSRSADGLVEITFSPAYVHDSAGTPDHEGPTGWTQNARLTLGGATVIGTFPTLPRKLSDGTLKSEDQVLDNLIPLPFTGTAIELRLLFTSGDEVLFSAKNAELRPEGEATFVEEVRF